MPDDGMTQGQELHLLSIKMDFAKLVDAKYRAGQAEHGGNLYDADTVKLIDLAIEEAIDQVVYLLTIRDKIS